MPSQQHNIKTILSGGIAGMVSKTFTAPLERVQMLNQTGAVHSSIVSTLKKVFRTQGIVGLWRGNFANVIRIFPHKSILFSSNDFLRSLVKKETSIVSFITGSVAGAIATAVTYPIDLIRAHLSGTLDPNANSIIKVTKNIIKQHGSFGLFRGLGVTLIGAVPYEGTRIGVYNVVRDWVPTTKHPTRGVEPHPIGKLGAGALAGACAGVVTYPTDTVRRMLQVVGADGVKQYNGVMDCLKRVYYEEGFYRFYSGLNAKLVRVIPDAAILFVTYETLKNYSI